MENGWPSGYLKSKRVGEVLGTRNSRFMGLQNTAPRKEMEINTFNKVLVFSHDSYSPT